MKKEQALAKIENNLPAFPILTTETEKLSYIIESFNGDFDPYRDLRRIPTPTNGRTTFEIPTPDGVHAVTEFTCISFLWKLQRAMYPSNTTASPGTRPLCSSDDGERGVGVPGGECRLCPQPYTRDMDTGRVACQKRALLFFVMADDLLPSIMSLPPSSLTSWKQYLTQLGNVGALHSDVVTRVFAERRTGPSGNPYSIVKFSRIQTLTNSEQERINDYASVLRLVLADQHPKEGSQSVEDDLPEWDVEKKSA
jgi:hypothetical protein